MDESLEKLIDIFERAENVNEEKAKKYNFDFYRGVAVGRSRSARDLKRVCDRMDNGVSEAEIESVMDMFRDVRNEYREEGEEEIVSVVDSMVGELESLVSSE